MANEYTTLAAALQALIFVGDWDFIGSFADANKFVDCLRCFAAPRRLLFDDEMPLFYMCLFCASCHFQHMRHGSSGPFRCRAMSECPSCNIVGYIEGLKAKP